MKTRAPQRRARTHRGIFSAGLKCCLDGCHLIESFQALSSHKVPLAPWSGRVSLLLPAVPLHTLARTHAQGIGFLPLKAKHALLVLEVIREHGRKYGKQTRRKQRGKKGACGPPARSLGFSPKNILSGGGDTVHPPLWFVSIPRYFWPLT